MKGNENSQDMCPRCMTPLNGQSTCPKCKFDPSTYTPAKHHLPPRTILDGKYLVGCVLGEGGFGITYVGWDLHLHTMVAIKEYFPTGIVFRDNTQSNVVSVFSGSGEEYFLHDREKFLEEARMLAKFDGNPGIVNVKNYFKENGTAYIVMEYVQGINLAVLMEQNNDKLPFDRVMKLLELPIKSLSEMHRQGTFHRDISPENLMVTNDNRVKLIDFGSSKTNKKDKSRFLKVRPGFSPLELYTTGGQEGPYSDIYALSATIYKAITGVTPPPATDRVQEDPLVPPSKAGAKGISPAWEKALMKGMAVKAQDRYQRVEDLYAALTGAKRGGKPEQKRGASPLAIAVACIAVLAVLACFLIFNNRKPAPAPAPEPIVEITEAPTEAPTEMPTEAPTEVPTEEPTEAPTETPTKALSDWLTEDMFAEVPEIWDAYVGGATAYEYPYAVHARVTPDGMSFISDGQGIEVAEWQDRYTEQRQDLSAERLNQIVDALCDYQLPVDGVELWDLRLESIDALGRDWRATNGDMDMGLYLMNCELNDLSALRGAGESLAALWVVGAFPYDDLSWLGDCPRLEALQLTPWGNDPEAPVDLESIARAPALRWLWLDSLPLANLSPLANARDLESLSLNSDDLEDISPLSVLTKLECLNLCGNHRLEDISPLASLTNLTLLNISNNRISDISPLAGLPNLGEVYLGANCITDFSPVEHVASVYGMDEQRSVITSETFAACPDVYDALLAHLGPIDAAAIFSIYYDYGLQVLIRPEGVSFSRNDDEFQNPKGNDPDARQPMENARLSAVMDALYASEMPISEIKIEDCELESLFPLARHWIWSTCLYLSNSSVPGDTAETLAAMGDSLHWLLFETDAMPFDNFDWADSCPMLRGINLTYLGDDTPVTDTSALWRVPNLDWVQLHHLNLGDEHVRGLESAAGLRSLHLPANHLTDISPLASLANLEELNISYNGIGDISPLAELSKLSKVWLDGNRITDFSPVEHVAEVYGMDEQHLILTPTEDMFAEIPEVWQAYVSGEEITDDLRLIIAPEGLRFLRNDMEDGINRESPNSSWEDLSPVAFVDQMDFLQSLDLPVRRVTYYGWDWWPINMDQFDRDWQWLREVEFANCGLPTGQSEQTAWGGIAAMGEKLEWLEISACDYDTTQFSWLAGCPNLTALRLTGTDGSPEDGQNLMKIVGGMENLTVLTVRRMSIRDLSPLAGLEKLETLDIAENEISDLSPLSNLPNLRYVALGNNAITDFSPVAHIAEVLGMDEQYP